MEMIRLLEIKDFGKYRKRMALYKCPQCSKESKHRKEDISRNKPLMCKSCSSQKTATIHGQRYTRLYRTWQGMRTRVTNKKRSSYRNYGGRGITMSKEWDNFLAFKDWAYTNGYKENLTIERIDVNGNYEPSNCTWIPHARQQDNTSRSLTNRYSEEVLSDAAEYYMNTNASLRDVAKLMGCSTTSVSKLCQEKTAKHIMGDAYTPMHKDLFNDK